MPDMHECISGIVLSLAFLLLCYISVLYVHEVDSPQYYLGSFLCRVGLYSGNALVVEADDCDCWVVDVWIVICRNSVTEFALVLVSDDVRDGHTGGVDVVIPSWPSVVDNLGYKGREFWFDTCVVIPVDVQIHSVEV